MITIKMTSILNNEIMDFLVQESYFLYKDLNSSSLTEETLKSRLKTMYIEDMENIKIYVAYHDQKIIGCACLKNSNYLRDIYVKKEYQRRGVGSLLINQILCDYHSEITLNTYFNLIQFYRKMGFTVIKKY